MEYTPQDEDLYPSDTSLNIMPDYSIIGCKDLICTIESYPQLNTLHEILISALDLNDRNSVEIIMNREGYLPIRWNDIIPHITSSYTSLFMNSPHLSDKDKQELSYMIGHPLLIDHTLALKYRYLPHILSKDRILVYPVEELEIDSYNYLRVLNDAMIHGRVDVIEYTLYMYGKDSVYNILDRAYPYHPDTIRFLLQHGYVTLTPILRAIIYDNPSVLPSGYNPSKEDLDLILRMDSVNMFIHIGQHEYMYSKMNTKIRKYLLKQGDTNVAKYSDSSDLSYALSIWHDNNGKRLAYLRYALSKGYIEILDKYMEDRDIEWLLTMVDNIPSSSKAYIEHRM